MPNCVSWNPRRLRSGRTTDHRQVLPTLRPGTVPTTERTNPNRPVHPPVPADYGYVPQPVPGCLSTLPPASVHARWLSLFAVEYPDVTGTGLDTVDHRCGRRLPERIHHSEPARKFQTRPARRAWLILLTKGDTAADRTSDCVPVG